MTSKELAKIAYNALDDKKGVNITIIDISEISIIADYFIIAGGTNENQVKALAKAGSATGWRTCRIGASAVTDTGEHL